VGKPSLGYQSEKDTLEFPQTDAESADSLASHPLVIDTSELSSEDVVDDSYPPGAQPNQENEQSQGEFFGEVYLQSQFRMCQTR
jgi:hypothetical protein